MAAQKSVLITGCTPGGVGHSLARAFQLCGLHVIATARKTSKIADLAALGIDCVPLTVDDAASVTACYNAVEKLLQGKGLDYLVNNAGQVTVQPAIEVDLANAADVFAVNVLAVMNINKTFFPLLMRAKGTIVHVGSVGGHAPFPFHSVYSASKAALKAYCDTVRLELAPFEVKITYVQLGSVKTNVYSHDRSAEYVKKDGLYGLSADLVEKRLGNWEGTDPEELGRDLANSVLSRHRDVIWIGAEAGAFWFITCLKNWLGVDLMASAQYKSWGLAKIAAAVKDGQV